MVEVVKPPAGTVGLFVSPSREDARGVAGQVAAAVRAAGYAVAEGELSDDTVVLVTIGGDGTLLRAAQLVAPRGVPLFGINTGRLGFLTEIDADGSEAQALVKVLRDGFLIEERLALAATLHGAEHFALNDIVVRRRATGHMAPFGLFIDGNEAARVPADGIVIATPTGSTAYLLSAGGPILAPDLAGFGIVALAPHTLFTRPLVVPQTSVVTLTYAGEESATLEADGQVVDELIPGEAVTVRRYPRPIRFARRGPLNFFAVLEDKLRWNAPVKGREEAG